MHYSIKLRRLDNGHVEVSYERGPVILSAGYADADQAIIAIAEVERLMRADGQEWHEVVRSVG